MEQKIATSIEQSKKLLELGLNSETSDMLWAKLSITDDYPVTLMVKAFSGSMQFQGEDLMIPTWSLSALLELMPQEILINGFPTRLHIEKTKLGYSFEYIDTMGHAQCFVSFPLIEGACEMVCWLLEQGYIKKGGKK